MSLATHTRRPFATANWDVGDYELHDGRAIPRVLAFALGYRGHGDLVQWRRMKRARPLKPAELVTERAVLAALRADARKMPLPTPVKRNNNTVRLK